MNKQEIIDAIQKQLGGTKVQAEEAYDAVFNAITNALKKGTKVSLYGFGVFEVVKRKARMARNPQTGEQMKIPARKVAKFKPAKALKEAVK